MRKPRNQPDGAGRAARSFPTRWVERSSADPSASSEHDIEGRIGSLLEKVPPPPPLGRAAHGRIEARLRDSRGSDHLSARSWIGRFAMGSGLGAFSLLIGGVVVAASGVGAWWRIAQTRAPSHPVAEIARDDIGGTMTRHRRPRSVAPSARSDATEVSRQVTPEPAAEPVPALEGQPPAPLPPPSPDRPPAAAPFPSVSPGLRAPTSAPSVSRRGALSEPSPTQLTQETRLLKGALAELRQHHDGRIALATLNDYLGRFPNGILVGEARRARIDALLLLGRKDEARSALDHLDLEPVGRGQELLLIRGELRAHDDCAEAIADFDRVIDRTASAALVERALFGRAVCHRQEGQGSAARADALAYLDRFPAGRFAGAARRLAAAEDQAAGATRR